MPRSDIIYISGVFMTLCYYLSVFFFYGVMHFGLGTVLYKCVCGYHHHYYYDHMTMTISLRKWWWWWQRNGARWWWSSSSCCCLQWCFSMPTYCDFVRMLSGVKEEEEKKRLRMDAHLMFPFPFIPPLALPL